MSERLKKRHLFFLAAVAALLGFQNCAQQSNDSASNSSTSYESGLPFAYKAVPDTIAYMSCENMSGDFDRHGYFSFRMGAYETGGVTMTQAFSAATAHYPLTERANLFSSSDVNANATLTLSIRKQNALRTALNSSTSGFITGVAIDSFLPPLDSPTVAGPLAAAPAGVLRGYFPGPDDKRLMEASLRLFGVGEYPPSSLRADFNAGTYELVAGYSSSDIEDASLKSPVNFPESISPPPTSTRTEDDTVFGTGYLIGFVAPTGFNAGAKVLINGFKEVDLATHAQTGSWNCDPKYQYRIVRSEDYATQCPISYDQGDADAITKLRRVLRTEYWYINTTAKCIVPRNTGDYCYGGQSPDYTNPHFFSLCIRN